MAPVWLLLERRWLYLSGGGRRRPSAAAAASSAATALDPCCCHQAVGAEHAAAAARGAGGARGTPRPSCAAAPAPSPSSSEPRPPPARRACAVKNIQRMVALGLACAHRPGVAPFGEDGPPGTLPSCAPAAPPPGRCPLLRCSSGGSSSTSGVGNIDGRCQRWPASRCCCWARRAARVGPPRTGRGKRSAPLAAHQAVSALERALAMALARAGPPTRVGSCDSASTCSPRGGRFTRGLTAHAVSTSAAPEGSGSHITWHRTRALAAPSGTHTGSSWFTVGAGEAGDRAICQRRRRGWPRRHLSTTDIEILARPDLCVSREQTFCLWLRGLPRAAWGGRRLADYLLLRTLAQNIGARHDPSASSRSSLAWCNRFIARR